jgi:hypothetical protein
MLILSKRKSVEHNDKHFFLLDSFLIMGNSLPQNRSKNGLEYLTLKQSRSLRKYTRSTSLITSCLNSNNNRRNISVSKPPIDAEIIDIHALHCQISTLDINKFLKQFDYIYSCVRKDKGLFGKYLNKK